MQITKYGKKFCASSPIYNNLSSTTEKVTLTSDLNSIPLFGLCTKKYIWENDASGSVKSIYYMYNGDQTKTFNGLSCEGTLEKLGTNIQSY